MKDGTKDALNMPREAQMQDNAEKGKLDPAIDVRSHRRGK